MSYRINKILKNPAALFLTLGYRGFFRWMSDEQYLKIAYWCKLHKKLDLDHPDSFSEKLQWLKIHDRNPLYTRMVDKYEAKKIVSEIVGDDYVIPTLGIYNTFDEIDFNSLPNQFILKCTHDSGSFAICKDKATFDVDKARKVLTRGLRHNPYWSAREWPYKNVKPRIIAEKYIDTLGNEDSIEYKVTCSDGKVAFGTICKGKPHVGLDQRTNDTYDRSFKYMPWYAFYKNTGDNYSKPAHWDELMEFCEKLTKGIPSVRVDTYYFDNHIYFGEFTFYTWGGFLQFTPDEWDKKLSRYIKLPKENNE